MKKVKTIAAGLLAAGAVLGPAAAQAAAGTLTSGDYKGAEGAMHYQLYVPSSYSPGTPMPLVVALHGCTQTADSFRALTRWDAQAEAKGFIVVFPQQDADSNPLKCWNFFLDADMHRGSGEPARIAAVTSLIENTHAVDPHRVYVTGLSAGGAMASVMAAAYPDYFAALGVGSGCEYAATATCAGYKSADPTQAGQAAHREMGPRARAMPCIAFQGDQDKTVPPVNADQLVQQWLTTNALATNGSVPSRPTSTRTDLSSASRPSTVRTYAADAPVSYWVVHGMGHAWSGGDGSQPFADPAGPDETALMYTFFMDHPAPSLTRPAPPSMLLSHGSAGSGRPAGGADPPASTRSAAVPSVSRVKRSRGRVVFTLSGPGTVTLRLQRRARHRYVTKVRIVRRVARAGRVSIALPRRAHGHRLRQGHYRVRLTPAAPDGRRGRSRSLGVVLR
jgi:poly(hydroxyalkanoate) depolymerase family esterase